MMGEEVTVTDPKDSKQMEFTTSEERMGVAASGAVPEEDASEDKEMAAKGDEKDDSKDAAEDTPENDKEAEDKAPTDMDMDKDEEPALDAGLHPFLLRVVKGRLTRDSPVIPIQVFPYSTLRDVVSLLVPHFPSLASRLVSVTLSAVSFSGDTAVSTNSLGTLQNSIKPLDSLDGKTLQEAGIQSGHFLSMTLVEGRESAIMAARGTRLVGAAARLGPRVGSHRDTDRSEEPTGRKSQPNRSREIDPALFGIDSRHERRGEERGGRDSRARPYDRRDSRDYRPADKGQYRKDEYRGRDSSPPRRRRSPERRRDDTDRRRSPERGSRQGRW